MRIQNNITAINTHRNYNIANNQVASSAEKLSSGYRINRAGDDAAGLAISEKMRAQIRGLNMASKNSMDAVSMVQTAEGALQSTHDILQRMRELAVQSSSDTNEQVIDRGALQLEFEQLKIEIDEIASKTRFNDQNLIDGTFQKYSSVLTGATDVGGVKGIVIDNAKSGEFAFAKVGVAANVIAPAAGTAPGTTTPVGGKTNLVGQAVATYNGPATGTLTATFAVAKNAQNNGMQYTLDILGSDTDAATFILRDTEGKAVSTVQNVDLTKLTGTGTTLDISFADIGTLTFTASVAAVTVDQGAAALSAFKTAFGNNQSAIYFDNTGVDPVAGRTDPGYVTLTVGSDTVKVGLGETSATFQSSGVQLQFDAITDLDINTAGAGRFTGSKIVISQNKGASLIIQSGANQGDETTINIDAMNTAKLGIAFSSIDTQKNASKAITEVNNALNMVSTQRAALGAVQNRLEFKIANLDTSAENLQAAESRIRDVDMAKEMTAFSKKNILVQAATAMLAQANSAPQNVLQLLR